MLSAGKMNVFDEKIYGEMEKVGNASKRYCLCLLPYDEALLLTRRKLRTSCKIGVFLDVCSRELCMSTVSTVSSEALLEKEKNN